MTKPLSRRDFVKTGSAATAAFVASVPLVHAAGQDKTISVGVIGCGGRGRGATEDIMNAAEALKPAANLRVVALGDMFKSGIDGTRRQHREKALFKVTDENAFVGLDAYKKVLDAGVDLVVLATPPGFRPIHFAAAIEAGKHVFFEKPVAVDPVGVRKVMEYGKKAAEKKLGVVTGTQRRHEKCYLEMMKRINDGAIGEVVAGRAYWNGGGVWAPHARQEGQDDVSYQIRNWYYYDWLCGDHIVEQHVHNVDVMNWALKGHPLRAVAVGGRQSRTAPEFGHIWDHFAVDFEYPNSVHVLSMCRHWNNTPGNVSEALVGTKGRAMSTSGRCSIDGAEKWRSDPQQRNPYVQEHMDLLESIREGKPLNEAQQIAESTLVAIMGREAAYTGKAISWDEILNSNLSLMPEKLELGPLPVRPIPVPGKPR